MLLLNEPVGLDPTHHSIHVAI